MGEKSKQKALSAGNFSAGNRVNSNYKYKEYLLYRAGTFTVDARFTGIAGILVVGALVPNKT